MTTPFAKIEARLRRKHRASLRAPRHQSDAQGSPGRSRLRAPVNVPVQKREEFNLPFIKQLRFNGLRFRVLIYRSRAIAPKWGVDNFPADSNVAPVDG